MRQNGVSNAIAAGLLIAGIVVGTFGVYVTMPAQTTTVTQTETTTATSRTTYTPVILTYQACFLGYSGFQVKRYWPSPSTWVSTLPEGSKGYVFYEYNVTKGLDLFLKDLHLWKEGINYANYTSLWADVSGSTVVHVEFNPGVPGEPAQSPIIRPNQSFPLGVQLSPESYIVRGNLVNVTWSLTGLKPGGWWVISDVFENHYFVVSPPTEIVNATSETSSGNCYEMSMGNRTR
jgi:hypothetical protein